MNHCTKEQLIAFETQVKALWEAGELPYLLHLCGGNEDALIDIFKDIQPGDWVFSTHRNHYHALLSGMDADVLLEKIQRGDSMFVFGKPLETPALDRMGIPPLPDAVGLHVNFLTSSVLAGTCAIAAGVAWTLKNSDKLSVMSVQPKSAAHNSSLVTRHSPHVWCFLGDGAEDEGHFYEAVNFVEGHRLPCTFIIEDNDRSVDTDKATRRGEQSWWDVPGDKSLGYHLNCVRRYHYPPAYPHAGSGCKHKIVFKSAPSPQSSPPSGERKENQL